MYAVIRTGGKQYRVEAGMRVDVEKLEGEVGDSITFGDVLLVGDTDKATVGSPLVSGAKVVAKILEQHRGPKLRVFKKIRRQGKQLRKGHRQSLTRVQVMEVVS